MSLRRGAITTPNPHHRSFSAKIEHGKRVSLPKRENPFHFRCNSIFISVAIFGRALIKHGIIGKLLSHVPIKSLRPDKVENQLLQGQLTLDFNPSARLDEIEPGENLIS